MHPFTHLPFGDRPGPAAYLLAVARERLAALVTATALTVLATLRSWSSLGVAPMAVPAVMAAVAWAVARRSDAEPAR